MAKLLADRFSQIPHAGEYGNESVAHDGKTLAAMQIADTLDLAVIPGSSKVISGFFINAALGASTTMSIGWRYADGSAGGSATALVAATATSGVTRTAFTAAPFVVDKDIIVYATLAGGAATGQFDVVVSYIALGTK